MQKRIAGAILACALIMLLLANSAVADGMVHIYEPEALLWKLHNENSQVCAINHEHGMQNMIVLVDVNDLNSQKVVWLLPVPAKPDETAIGIVSSFPNLYGEEVKEKKNAAASTAFLLSSLSQIYPAPVGVTLVAGVALVATLIRGITVDAHADMETWDELEKDARVTVHEHIEVMGLTTELITAQDSIALNAYLSEKGLNLPQESLAVIDEYIGKNYSFVVSWATETEQTEEYPPYHKQGSTLGVYLSFPSEKIYFPLKPTSVYGSSEIPVQIYVLGYVTPELYEGIAHSTTTEYLIDDYYRPPPELQAFFNNRTDIQNMRYTKIEITAPAEHFTSDLWIAKEAPIDVALADFVVENFLLLALLSFAIISCLASLLAGIIIFREDSPNLAKFALFGLANFLSIVGFSLAAYIIDVEKRFTKAEKRKAMKTEWLNPGLWAVGLSFLLIIVLTLPEIPILLSLMAEIWQYYSAKTSLPYVGVVLFIIFFLLYYFSILLCFSFLLLAPFTWGWFNRRRTMKFTVLFSVLFMALTTALWILAALI